MPWSPFIQVLEKTLFLVCKLFLGDTLLISFFNTHKRRRLFRHSSAQIRTHVLHTTFPGVRLLLRPELCPQPEQPWKCIHQAEHRKTRTMITGFVLTQKLRNRVVKESTQNHTVQKRWSQHLNSRSPLPNSSAGQ